MEVAFYLVLDILCLYDCLRVCIYMYICNVYYSDAAWKNIFIYMYLLQYFYFQGICLKMCLHTSLAIRLHTKSRFCCPLMLWFQ